MQYCQVNYERQQCKLRGRIGPNWEAQRCGIGRRIRGCNDAILEVELGGRMMQNWEVEQYRIGSTAVQIRPGYWEMQRCRIERCDYAELAGELEGLTMSN